MFVTVWLINGCVWKKETNDVSFSIKIKRTYVQQIDNSKKNWIKIIGQYAY